MGNDEQRKLLLEHVNVRVKGQSGHLNSKAICWKYFGYLCETATGAAIDRSKYYCSVYVDECKQKN